MNWSEWYEEAVDRYLPDGAGSEATRIKIDIEAVREAGQTGADEGRFGYEELKRLAHDVIAWCRRNKHLILLPDSSDSWVETVKNTKDNKP
jgi:hypothetical protein